MTYRTTLAACGALMIAATTRAESVQIEVKDAKLTEQPKTLSKVMARPTLGEVVQVQQKMQTGWWNVKPADKPAGWITRNALASDATSVKSGEKGSTGVKEGEQALAYRPFNSEVEEAYRKDHASSANGFATLDKINTNPTYKVSDAQVQTFLAAGQLDAGGEQ